ncbi:hypothetical protein AVEN_53504-1 [Araneus ventricosus]|uniref:Uncharacterized protein n=1 Tax=Araneus ventricosus TaxID=182803 RepID=A0A4Y2JBM1_ARAVE|nr:hypothetical protein AVEN_53504-1 [Araneus ventricosus]
MTSQSQTSKFARRYGDELDILHTVDFIWNRMMVRRYSSSTQYLGTRRHLGMTETGKPVFSHQYRQERYVLVRVTEGHVSTLGSDFDAKIYNTKRIS